MVNVTIDGKTLEAQEGLTVLQAARQAGIEIPTLCDHPNLTPYGGCRLCLVEVEGARTLQPSCTLPINNNMVVRTDTPRVHEARKFVLSLIFSERNHFCPYCQVSGGDCELQNAAYAEGMTHWPLQPNWNSYPVDASHPFIILENNRCILCRRCVRVCGELVGNYTLGIEERGARSILVADLGLPLGSSSCISCGSCVQVCPTGAIIDRWSAYHGRETQVDTTQTICVSCSVGCGINVLTRDNNLVRIEGNWDAEINGGVICEFGRFTPMDDHRERVLTPLVRKDGALKAATWDEALNVIASKVKGGKVAAIASTRLPAEALHTFKQIFTDGLKSDLVTTTEEGAGTTAGAAVAEANGKPFEAKLSALEEAGAVLAFNLDLTKDHQVAGFFVKRVLAQGVNLVVVDNTVNGLDTFANLALKPKKGSEKDVVAALTAAVTKSKGVAEAAAKAGIPVEQVEEAAAYLAIEKPVLVYGKADVETVKALIELAKALKAVIISPKGSANSLTASQYGLDKPVVLSGHQAVFVALGDEEPAQHLLKQLAGVPFLAVQSSYISQLTGKADVVLPVTNWLEQDGHYVSLDGTIQEAHKAINPEEGILTSTVALTNLANAVGVKVDQDWKKALKQRAAVVEL
ncbi:MAG TPA: molybdopterin-dependent oxidoreductase [Longilinea sp.]|nr:molybdopterin-dependent oxidoreductase [Longilinea sp.]